MFFYLALFLGLLILFSLYGFWVAIHPPRYITNLTPKDLGWEFEDVTLTTKDNIKLDAWFVPAQNKSDKVIILLHGHPADKANLLHFASFLHQDFNLLFVDFRYFGNSKGSFTSVGFHEQKDLQAALDYLEGKDFDKIGVMGFSLGAAVAILTGSHDQRIKAIVSDSAFANIDLMGYEFYKGVWILKYPLTWLTKLWAQIFLGINTSEIAPEKKAAKLNIPILLIHSKKDATIQFENVQRIKEALNNNPRAQYFFLEEGVHGSLPPNLQAEYEKKVKEFFNINL